MGLTWKFSLLCGWMTLLVALICFGFSSIPANGMALYEVELQELQTARDVTCSFSSSPGTATAQKVKLFAQLKDGTKAEASAQKIECLGRVTYATNGFHAGGWTDAVVFAGFDFSLQADPNSLCSNMLAGTWPNVRIHSGNSRLVNFEHGGVMVPSDYRCGDFGWIGCRLQHDGFLRKKLDCVHEFGKTPEYLEVQRRGFDNLHYLKSGDIQPDPSTAWTLSPNCPALQVDAKPACCIDAHGQVRLGSAAELLEMTWSKIREANSTHVRMRVIAFVVLVISICLFCHAAWDAGCFSKFRLMFQSERRPLLESHQP